MVETRAKKDRKAKFIRPPNMFKQKVGSGGIDEKLLVKSQGLIDNPEIDFIPYAKQYLGEIEKRAAQLRAKNAATNDNFRQSKEALVAPIMQLKAHGGMFRYQLLSDVADIALQFVEAADSLNKDFFDVLAAHENTIRIIIGSKLKGDGGKEGFALIQELDNACRRYFKKYEKGKV